MPQAFMFVMNKTVNMRKNYLFLITFALVLLLTQGSKAQTDTTSTEEEEDFSQYADFGEAEEGAAKRYCTSKVLGLSPAKLISLGFDFQGAYKLTSELSEDSLIAGKESNIRSNHGIRFSANTPLISRTDLLINVGVNYLENRYTFEQTDSTLSHPLHQALNRNGLRSTGLNTTIFKPFNERQFIIIQAAADLNGDYSLDKWQPLRYTRYTGAFIYGWKPSDRKMVGFGLSRTYRAGALNYIPIMFLNYTHSSRKWGAECLFPARANFRFTVNARNMLFAGYELEGQSYRLGNGSDFASSRLQSPELRRSELRLRLTYEVSLYNFMWLSVQAGYRYNWLFNVDEGDFFRSFFDDRAFAIENSLGNPLYFNVSINLVSP
jgi:hypothetical protein